MSSKTQNESPVKFIVIFLVLFAAFYYFNVFFYGITSPGNYYSAFLDQHLNYVRGLRWALLHSSAQVLRLFGYTTLTSEYQLLLVGHGTLLLGYDCLGFGMMSFFAAFVIAFPKKLKAKLWFLFAGIVIMQLLNILRFVLLALFWKRHDGQIFDHHTIFNICIYIIIAVSIYFWVKSDDKKLNQRAAN